MKSLYEDTITVYNRRFRAILQPPFPPGAGQVVWERTVISGVMWKDRTQTNSTSEGKAFIDQTVSITIPVEADFGGKTYIDPAGFARLPQDDHAHWTVRTDEANPDIIVNGEGPEITALYTIDNLQRDHKHTKPRAVSDSSGQDVLPMWKVAGV